MCRQKCMKPFKSFPIFFTQTKCPKMTPQTVWGPEPYPQRSSVASWCAPSPIRGVVIHIYNILVKFPRHHPKDDNKNKNIQTSSQLQDGIFFQQKNQKMVFTGLFPTLYFIKVLFQHRFSTTIWPLPDFEVVVVPHGAQVHQPRGFLQGDVQLVGHDDVHRFEVRTVPPFEPRKRSCAWWKNTV